MARKRSRSGRHQAGIHQAICSVEALETRTLLSVATINAGQIIQAVPTDLLGVNTAPWDGLLTSASTLSLSQAAGLDSVRLGGGSYVDENWHFNILANGNTPVGLQAEYIENLGANGIVDVDYGTGSPEEAVAYWAYLNGNPNDTTNIASLFGNNPGAAEQWNASTSTWTQGVNYQTVGYWASLRAASPISGNADGLNFLRISHPTAFNFTDWEMGNEIYGSWEMDEHGVGGDALPMPAGDVLAAHDPTTLISFSRQFQTAMNSILSDGFESGAGPVSIVIDAQDPNNAGTNGFGTGTDGNWINDILTQSAAQGLTLGVIADHYYTTNSGSHASDSGLLAVSNSAAGSGVSGLSSYTNTSNPYNWATRAADYDTDIHTDLPGQNVQLIADEVNSIAGNPGEQSTSLVNGLFVADALGSILNTTGADGLGGYQGFDIWDLHNGPFTANFTSTKLYGWRMGGDYGILGNAEGAAVPIDGSNEPYPDYFAIQLASKIVMNGGTVVSATEDNETSMDTYAVLEANGNLELLVINKTKPTAEPPGNLPDQTLTEQFNIAGYTANNQATIWQYGVAQDDAQDNATNDATSLMTSPLTLGISGGSFSLAIPDYSMSVIILTQGTAPTVTQAAAANPSPVTGTTTTLSALGSENGSGAGLNYTWSATTVPGGAATPTYSVNGTNAASTSTATFFAAGNYTFLVTISDASNNSITSSVNVTVNQTASSVVVSPSPVTINEDTNQIFAASADDQFGNTLAIQPAFTWQVISGIGSINATGRYASPASAGSATVQANISGTSIKGTAAVTIVNATPTVATPASANANPVTTTSTALSVLGADDAGEGNLSYTWSDTGPTGVTFTGNTNGSNAAKNITANFTQAGSYNFLVTITDSGGAFVTSPVTVTVQQTPTGAIVTPSNVTVAPGGTQQFSATATDQFGNAIVSPSFTWGITGAGNSIDGTGLATLGSTPGTYTVTATFGAASNTASITAATAPIVSAFQVNDGNVQRSMVDSLTLTFNEAVTLSPGAITLNLLSQTGGASTPITNFNLNSPNGGTTWVLTFTDPSYIGQSLPDGAYEVSVSAAGVGAEGLHMSADQNFTFYRLYGDFTGQGVVSGNDFTQLVGVLGKQTNASNWYIDYDNDGVIGGTDFTAFVGRLGKSMSIPSLPSVVLLAAAPPVPTSTPTTTQKPAVVSSVIAITTTPPKPVVKQKPRHGHR